MPWNNFSFATISFMLFSEEHVNIKALKKLLPKKKLNFFT